MSKQITYSDYKANTHKLELYLFADGVHLIENVAGLFRLADAMGVKAIYFTTGIDQFNQSRLKKVSRSTSFRVPSFWNIDRKVWLSMLPNHSLKLALEWTQSSEPLQNISGELPVCPIVIIVGNEVSGISELILNQCDLQVHLPMYGKNSSMNVVVATGMAVHEIIRQRLK